MPDRLTVREIHFVVDIPGFRTRAITVSTTLLDHLIAILARDPIPHRPNRLEPRARKRRPKNYQLLSRPRHEFTEIMHRNRYTKPLS